MMKNIILYILAGVCIVGGLFAGWDLYKVFTSRNEVYGNVEISREIKYTVFSREYDEILSYYDPVGSSQMVNINRYTEELNERVIFDATRNDYIVMVNDYPCLVADITAGYINASLDLVFYNTDGTISASTVLSLRLDFLYDRTRIVITVTNANTAVSYLNNLIYYDGLNIDIYYSETVFNKGETK